MTYPQRRSKYADVADRVLGRINFDGPDGCWLWTGAAEKQGYGVIKTGGRAAPVVLVHRLVYALFVEDIPAGLTIDHLCSVRRCVNPDHLELVTMPENSRRGCMRRWHGQDFWPRLGGQ